VGAPFSFGFFKANNNKVISVTMKVPISTSQTLTHPAIPLPLAGRSWRLLTFLSLGLASFAFAPAAQAKTALINAATVILSPSVEEQFATAQGYTVTVVSDAVWGAMTAAQFGSYDLLIAGDPDCGTLPPGLVASASVFGPVVLGTAGGRTLAGNRVVVGTDPVLHSGANVSSPRAIVINDGIAFAGKQPGRTGFYFDTTCAANYYGQSAETLSILAAISAGAGSWTIDAFPPCGGSVSLIASEPSFATLTTADLEGWSCSVHESFPTFPTDFSALAVATDTTSHPTCGVDPNTGLSACGEAYILIAGSSIVVASGSISVAPLDATNPVGTTHTVTANVTSGGSPLAGQVVTFTVTGQNAGAVGTCVPAGCVTDASGNVSFTYSDANGAGDDTIKASFTDAAGSLQSATAQKHWVGVACPTYALTVEVGYELGGTGTSGTYTAGPDSGFVIINNIGTVAFVGELRLDGKAGTGTDVADTSGPGYTLAPGASFRLEAGPEGSNQGGFNKVCGPDDGLILSIVGMAGTLPVNFQKFDKDMHSGSARDVHAPPSALTGAPLLSDSYILQGGDPFGGDTGDAFETTQTHASFEIKGTCGVPCALSCPGDIAVCNDPGQCGAVVSYVGPSLSGDCTGLTIACDHASGSTFPVGLTTVTCAATDATGAKVTSCTFNVTVTDTELPKIACPSIAPVNTDPGVCTAVVNYVVTATDNCAASLVCNPLSGSAFPKGLTTVNCTASDPSGNSASCSFPVTVVDNQPPTITCPGNITQCNDLGVCGATVNYVVKASDNCPGVTVSCSPLSGSSFAIGTTPVNCTATDAAGLSASCSFNVTVNLCTTKCPLTQGYWKNHASAWPASSLMLGTKTYSEAQLLTILGTAVGTGGGADASLILADQLIAAKLNLLHGSNPCPILSTIAAADALIGNRLIPITPKITPSTTQGAQMVALANTLNQYNNGLLTVGCTP
jgi:HYR domain